MLYIRVLDFESGASRDINDALDTLIVNGKHNPRGVILDLRGNPGGLLTEAYRTASLFLNKGEFIVGTDGRSRWNEERHYATGPDLTNGLPMAILVDNGSASASEIVAGSLHQLGRALLVGDTTFGKGLVQGITQLSDGSALRLTISRYYLEGGLYLNRFDSTLSDTGSGLAPDYPVQFVERDEFPLRIETSLLLQKFANLHQDEIIAASQHLALPKAWVDRFRSFSRDSGFIYTSSQTQSAQLLVELAVVEQSSKAVFNAALEILHKSQQDDMAQFERYADYIRTRLKQLAWERKFGTYREYADVIVRERPDIRYAAHLLTEGKQPKPVIVSGT
jgi:carboxyl-terminal processing protease